MFTKSMYTTKKGEQTREKRQKKTKKNGKKKQEINKGSNKFFTKEFKKLDEREGS